LKLGLDQAEAGDISQALEYLQESLVEAQRADDRAGSAQAHFNIGVAFLGIDEFGLAERHLEQAIALMRELSKDAHVAEGKVMLAQVYRNTNRLQESLDECEAALRICSITECQRADVAALIVKATVWKRRGNARLAASLIETAISTAESRGYVDGVRAAREAADSCALLPVN
jgi:tetratricopeptide (TPR) repeat protein